MLTSGYPVEVGLAASLARPGSNVTGNTIYAGSELWAKYVELFRELLPTLRRLGVLWDYLPPIVEVGEADLPLAELRKGAEALGIALRIWKIQSTEEVNRALAALAREPLDALFCTGGPIVSKNAPQIIDVALKQRLPTMTDFGTTLVRQGGLMASSANVAELTRQAAYFVDRILRGAKPADLPIQRPAKFDLMINMKTAKALGLTIPPSLLMRADEVIQ
jgi:putative ABC transport system substrate-binding protein